MKADNPPWAVRFCPLRLEKSADTLVYRNVTAVLIEVPEVNSPSNRLPDSLESSGDTGNQFWSYLQSLSPETVAQLSRPSSSDIFQVMERNIVGLLGALPNEHFNVMVTTSREDLGRLLASAMMSGYFIRNAEQRMAFEKTFDLADADSNSVE